MDRHLIARLRVARLVVVTAVIIASVVFLAKPLRLRYETFQYDRRLGIRSLVSAADELLYRAIEPRLSGGFAYRPQRPVMRGVLEGRSVDPSAAELYASAFGLMRSETRRRAADQHAIGLAQLSLGNVDQAGAALEAAAKAQGNGSIDAADDAALLSDLAAAYYARGVASKRIELILTSIDISSRASVRDPSLAVAAFNRALAIEAIHAPAQAITAWNSYLALDAESGWAAEAREHVEALKRRQSQRAVTSSKRPQVSVESQATRIEEELLPTWGEAFRVGNAEAAGTAIREAGVIAEDLRACCGDSLHVRSVEMATHASEHDRGLALRLAEAHEQYRDGRKLYRANRTAEAIPLFISSRDTFREAGDIFGVRPWKYVAASHVYLQDIKDALPEIEGAIDFCSQQSCTAAAMAQLFWVRAVAWARSGDPQEALTDYQDALKGFEAGRELENAASVRSLIAEMLEFLGAGEDAWPYRRVALEMAEKNGTLDRIYLAHGEAADAAFERGHVVSARLFRDFVIAAARREQNSILLANSLLLRAHDASADDSVAARRDLDEADALLSHVPDTGRRKKQLAVSSVVRARFVTAPEAIQHLTSAIRYFEENQMPVPDLYLARAEAEEQAGQAQLAEADYLQCIQQIEGGRSTLTDAALRERYFERASDVFDRSIRYLWSRGRRDDAFRLAERSRGRELNEGSGPPPLTLAEVQHSLRSGDVLVEYALLPDRVLVWIVQPSSVSALELPPHASDIAAAVNAVHDAFDSDADGGDPSHKPLARLGDLVYEPIASAVRSAKRIIVVANKSLRAAPFSALRDNGRYLIEDHDLVIAPSAAAYVDAVLRDRAISRRASPSVLLTSYTAPDDARHLPRLEGGSSELNSMRSVYKDAQVLDEQQATPRSVLSAAANATAVHIIAHGVLNEDHPEFSSLALAPSPEGRDLYAHTIAKASLRSTRLVFLSACGTAGRTTYNDPPLTLPESFLSAGVPVVIGALRPVDDRATAAFAVAFHRAFLKRGDAIAALSETQRQSLASGGAWRDPRYWSPWIAIGGAD
jgi:tetratricopeptide (TPR) repeat protein